MTDKNKPEWGEPVPIDAFEKWLNGIVGVKFGWEFTSADTTKDWIILETRAGKTVRVSNYSLFLEYFEFRPSSQSLFMANYKGNAAREKWKAIREFERANAEEIAVYKKLKAKFEDK